MKMRVSKWCKAIVLAACAAAVIGGLSGCGGSGASSAAGSSKAEGGKTKLVIGASGIATNWAIMQDGKNDPSGLEGFAIDMWNEVAKRNGWEVEYKLGQFAALWGMMDNDQIDSIAANVSESPERMEKYLFSEPFYLDNSVLVYKPSLGDPKDLAFFEGKTIGVGAPTTSRLVLDDFIKKKGMNIKEVNLDGETDVIPNVLSGVVEAGIMDRSTANLTIRSLKADLKVYDPQYRVMGSAAPFKKSERGQMLLEGTNKALAEMKKDGTMKKLAQKWLNDDLSKMPKEYWEHWDQKEVMEKTSKLPD